MLRGLCCWCRCWGDAVITSFRRAGNEAEDSTHPHSMVTKAVAIDALT